MTDRRISVRERVRTLDYLDWLARELNKAAAWLGDAGFETEADVLDGAARDTMAVVGLMSRPLRIKPPPEGWQDAPDGHPQG